MLAKGTAQLNTGIDAELMKVLRAFAERRGERIRAVVEAAVRRHLANPPPLPGDVPLPPVPPEPPAKPRGKKP